MMARAFLWCRYCGEPHRVGLPRCPTTGKPLETSMNRVTPAHEWRLGPLVGQLFNGRYRLRKVLGEGSKGRVFLADDVLHQVPVAIKVLKRRQTEKEDVLRFEQEARLAQSINHANVCRMLDWGRLPDRTPYLVMEALIQGRTLFRLLRRVKGLDEPLAMSITAQLLCGLQATHDVGIVHRDVKPGNIFLLRRPTGYPMVKLLDFGLAKPPKKTAMVHTRPGFAFGTPGYIAPEVLTGCVPDARSDIWGAGVVLFEMLAGVRPFRDPTDGGSPFAAVTDTPRSLAACAPYVPERLVRVVRTALLSDPRDRFQTANEFLREIEGTWHDLGHSSGLLDTDDSLRARGSPERITDTSLAIIDLTPTGPHSQSGPTIVNDDTPTTGGTARRPR